MVVGILLGPIFAGCIDNGGEEDNDLFAGVVVSGFDDYDCDAPASYEANVAPIQPPHDSDQPVPENDLLAFATNEELLFLRWYVDVADPQNTHFMIERGPLETLLEPYAIVRPAQSALDLLDRAEAGPLGHEGLIGEILEDISPLGATTLTQFYDLVHDHPAVGHLLASRYPSLAVALGNAWVDASKVGTFVYRVTMVEDTKEGEKSQVLGTREIVLGQPTPLPSPTALECITSGTQGLGLAPRGPTAQALSATSDRHHHQRVYLRWTLYPEDTSGLEARQINGYDVHRSTGLHNPDAHTILLTSDGAVFPRAAGYPVGQYGNASSTNDKMDRLDAYFIDTLEEPGPYTYYVTPRDLLGRIQEPGLGTPWVTAGAHDLIPPNPVLDLKSDVDHEAKTVTLSWTHPVNRTGSGEIVRLYLIEHATHPQAANDCTQTDDCWVRVGESGTTHAELDVPDDGGHHWYRVRAVDGDGNRATASNAVLVRLEDHIPPGPIEGIKPSDLQICSSDPRRIVRPCMDNSTDSTALLISRDEGDTLPLVIQTTPGTDGEQPTRVRIFASLGADEQMVNLGDTRVDAQGRARFDLGKDVPLPLDAHDLHVRAYALDAVGNHGPMSNPLHLRMKAAAEPTIPSPPQGVVITGVETRETSEGPKAEVLWTTLPWTQVERFFLQREELSSEPETLQDDVGTARSALQDIEYGRVYVYKVTMKTLGGQTFESPPYYYVPFKDMDRPMQKIPWESEDSGFLQATSDGVQVAWKCPACGQDGGQDGGQEGGRPFVVWRAVGDGPFVQMTPLLVETDTAEAKKLRVTRNPSGDRTFLDHEAITGGTYRYQVVEHDPDSLEAVATTDVIALRNPNGQRIITLEAARSSSPHGACENTHHPNGAWTATLPPGFTVSGNGPQGSGTLKFEDKAGTTLNVRLDGIKLDPNENIVCAGQITGHNPNTRLVMTGPGTARLVDLEIDASREYPGSIQATVEVELDPHELIGRSGGITTHRLELRGATIDNEGRYLWKAPDADPGKDCEEAAIRFPLSRLSAAWVPLDGFEIAHDGLRADTGCIIQRAPIEFDTPGEITPYRRYTVLGTGLHPVQRNDGLLQHTAVANSLHEFKGSGLTGTFTTTIPPAWTSHAPFGTTITTRAPAVIVLSQGTLTEATLTGVIPGITWRDIHGEKHLRVGQTINKAVIGLDGAIHESVSLQGEGVSWPHPDGFSTTEGSWELLLNPIVVSEKPERIGHQLTELVASQNHERDAGALGKKSLVPGYNKVEKARDGGKILWTNCGSSTVFAADLHLDLRYGGITGRFRGESLHFDSLYGYDAGFELFQIGFLDHIMIERALRGEIALPAPAGITIPISDLVFDGDMCVSHIIPGGGGHVLHYWELPMTIDLVRFEPRRHAPGDSWTHHLWVAGPAAIPHLTVLDQPGPVPVDVLITPNGQVPEIRPARPDTLHAVSGFPAVLQRIEPSKVGEGPRWEQELAQEGNLVDPPDPEDKGTLDIHGVLFVPYFGALKGNYEEDLVFTVQTWAEDYLGFSVRPMVQRTWIDVEFFNITLTYDHVVYLPGDKPRFVAIEDHAFVPDDWLPFFGMVDRALDMLNNDRPKGNEGTGGPGGVLMDPVRAFVRDGFDQANQEVARMIDDANRSLDEHLEKLELDPSLLTSPVREYAEVALKENMTQWREESLERVDEVLDELDDLVESETGGPDAEQWQSFKNQFVTTLDDVIFEYGRSVERPVRTISEQIDETADELLESLEDLQGLLQTVQKYTDVSVDALNKTEAVLIALQGNLTTYEAAVRITAGIFDAIGACKDHEIHSACDGLDEATSFIDNLLGEGTTVNAILTIVAQITKELEWLLDTLAETSREITPVVQDAHAFARDVQERVTAIRKGIDEAVEELTAAKAKLDTWLELAQSSLAVMREAMEEARNAVEELPDDPKQFKTDVKGQISHAISKASDDLQKEADGLIDEVLDHLQAATNDLLEQWWHELKEDLSGELKSAAEELGEKAEQASKVLLDEAEGRLDELFTQIEALSENLVQLVPGGDDGDGEGVDLPSVEDLARLISIQSGFVLEPDNVTATAGLASGLSILAHAYEALGIPSAEMSKEDEKRTKVFERLDMPAASGYHALLVDIDHELTQLNLNPDQMTSNQKIRQYIAAGNELPGRGGMGGGTGPGLAQLGLSVRDISGEMTFSRIQGDVDWQFEEFDLGMGLEIRPGGEGSPLFAADFIGLRINRHFGFLIAGQGIETQLFGPGIRIDIIAAVEPATPAFEAGFAVQGLRFEVVDVQRAAVAFGLSPIIQYIGLEFEGVVKLSSTGPSVTLGGAIVAGKIDPESEVLNLIFPDVMSRIRETPIYESGRILSGFYLSGTGVVPVYENGCILSVNLGAQVATWTWWSDDAAESPLAGGRIRGIGHATAICVIKARVEATLEMNWQGDYMRMTMEGWLAAGGGLCDVTRWNSWENRWWDEGFGCLAAGALIRGEYINQRNPEWSVDAEYDYKLL